LLSAAPTRRGRQNVFDTPKNPRNGREVAAFTRRKGEATVSHILGDGGQIVGCRRQRQDA